MNQGSPTPPQVPPEPTTGQPAPRQVFRPYVTYILMGICVAVYLVQVSTQSAFGQDIPAALGIKDNGLILQGQLWRLFTPIFLHGSILHIGFNMYALYFLGRTLERFYGRRRYLALFLLSGFAGNVISFMFSKYDSLGSSTAIFGLLGAEGVLIYQNREIFGPIARTALSQVVIIAVVNLIIGLTPNSAIDNWGHIGGLVGGTLFAWFAGPVLKVTGQHPSYTVMNARTQREVLAAGLGVGILFVFLTIVAILVRNG